MIMGDEQTQKVYDAVQNGEKVYAYCYWEELTLNDLNEMHISCGVVEDDGNDVQCDGFCVGQSNVITETQNTGDTDIHGNTLYNLLLVGDATEWVKSFDAGDQYWLSPSQDPQGADPDAHLLTREELEERLHGSIDVPNFLAVLDCEEAPLERVNLDCPLCEDGFAELNESDLPDFDSTTIIRHYTCNRGHKYDVTYEAVKKELVTPDKGE